jgi:AAA domain
METDTASPDLEAGFNSGDEPAPISNLDEMEEAKRRAHGRAYRIFKRLPAGATRADFLSKLRADFPVLAPPRANRIVDGVIREFGTRPIPQFVPDADGFIHTGCSLAPTEGRVQLRQRAINMYLEKRATRPKHDPIPTRPVSDAPAEEHAISVEERRLAMGLPSGILRTVDYEPGQQHTAPTWLVKGLMPNRGLGLLVGESQSGKSFLAIHAAVCVARGLPFFGKKTKPGAVLYIAAEGGSGVLPRIRAADEAVGALLPANHMLRPSGAHATAPIKVVVESPNLSRDGDTAALARTIQAAAHAFKQDGHTLSLVVVDTWHAALAGADEQASADAGHALKPLQDAAEGLGVFTLIVHHPGKDLERGARGTSALRAAVDTEFDLRVPGFEGPKAKPAAVPRRATLTKQRDGAVGEEFHYRLNVVELGRDEDGDPWTTCTVAPCDAQAASANGPKGKGDVRLKRAIEAAVAERGQARVEMKVVRGFFNNGGPANETDGARRAAWSRAVKAGRDGGLIETDSVDQYIWFSSTPGQ